MSCLESQRMILRFLIIAGVVTFANSHATCTIDEMTTNDKYMATSIRIGHNCGYDGGDYTTKVDIMFLPYSNFAVQSIKGGMMPDWNFSHTSRDVDQSLGYSSLTSTYDIVSFTYIGEGKGMAPDEFLDFPLKFKLADADGNFPFSVDDIMFLPTLQICTNNTYRDWANGSIWPRSPGHKDDYHEHMPSITVVAEDEYQITKKYYKKEGGVLIASIALGLAVLVIIVGIFLLLRLSERIAILEKNDSKAGKPYEKV